MTAEQMAIEAARAADDKKASDVRIMDMRDTLGITDYFVLASGRNDRQVKRIRDAIEEKLREHGVKPARREGERFGRWILLDYIDFVVHIFLEEERDFYSLERLWGNVPLVEWREEKVTEAGTT
jgi:ribosome-associated protein